MHDRLKPLLGERCHAVYFYRNLDEMGATIGRFLAEGLATGQSAIILAQPETRDCLVTQMGHLGIDIDAVTADGSLLLVDATAFLQSIMIEGRLDPALAIQGLVSMIGQVRQSSSGQPIRLYGEGASMLWRAGEHVAALELENLELTLPQDPPLAIVCGYGNHPPHESTANEDICAFHSHVMFESGELSTLS